MNLDQHPKQGFPRRLFAKTAPTNFAFAVQMDSHLSKTFLIAPIGRWFCFPTNILLLTEL